MVRAAVQASTSYGSGAMSSSGRELAQARFHQSSVQSQRAAGRSITLMLQLSGIPRIDPAYHLNVSPLLSVATSIWDGWVPRGVVVQGLEGAWQKLQAVSYTHLRAHETGAYL
eukprot:1895064-Pyramimonas_sp.AAC.1